MQIDIRTMMKKGALMSERDTRQRQILQLMRTHSEPIRGEEIAQICHVTRQVVVHEIALLRASGIPIVATPRGYYLDESTALAQQTVISVRHRPEETAHELYTLVDYGIQIDNVIVEHPLYGELRGMLQLRSRRDVDHFLAQVRAGQVALLSSLTDGYHLHTVTYPDKLVLEQAVQALRQKGISVID